MKSRCPTLLKQRAWLHNQVYEFELSDTDPDGARDDNGTLINTPANLLLCQQMNFLDYLYCWKKKYLPPTKTPYITLNFLTIIIGIIKSVLYKRNISTFKLH